MDIGKIYIHKIRLFYHTKYFSYFVLNSITFFCFNL